MRMPDRLFLAEKTRFISRSMLVFLQGDSISTGCEHIPQLTSKDNKSQTYRAMRSLGVQYNRPMIIRSQGSL